MISHTKFSALKLADFCPGDPQYREWEDDGGELLVESIRGVDFARHALVESGVLDITIDLLDYGENPSAGVEVLKYIGFPVTRATAYPEVVALLGQPKSSRLDPDRGYDYFRTDFHVFAVPPPNGYEIWCSWLHPGSVGRHPPLRTKELCLWSVRIRRDDIKSFPWRDD